MADTDYLTTLLVPDASHLIAPNRGTGGASFGYGTPTLVQDAGAYNGYAISFASAWINLPDVWGIVDLPGTSTDFTIDVHLKMTSYASNSNVFLAARASGGLSAGITSSGYLQISSAYVTVLATATTGKISLNSWTHIRFCRTAGSIYVFVDGVIVLTVTSSVSMTYRNYGIGGYNGTTDLFGGLIDEVAFFDGVALSTTAFTPPTQAWSIPTQGPSILAPHATVGGQPQSFPLTTGLLDPVSATFPVYFGGPGRIAGTTTVKSSPSNLPVARRVRLYEKVSGAMVAETWSDAAGNYVFAYLNPGLSFYVTAFDQTNTYEAVAADNLVPTT